MSAAHRATRLAAAALAQLLAEREIRRLWVAFSGGADSMALLLSTVEFASARGLEVVAHHVDHGLHADSASWARYCEAQARRLGVRFELSALGSAAPAAGESIEAWARERRYEALAAPLTSTCAVLTAHHREDQVETVLQRVFSGSGPHGLAGIAGTRDLGRGLLARPLLHCARDDLRALLQAHGVSWIEDPSNLDRRFLRNRLRHDTVPLLGEAMPGFEQGLLRLAALQEALARGLDAWADALLGPPVADTDACLRLGVFERVPPELHGALLRRALVRAGCPPPRATVLREILATVCRARADAAPLVHCGAYAVRRYRDALHLTREPLPPVPPGRLPWDFATPLVTQCGTLDARAASGHGLAVARLQQARVEVGFRAGGERCRPHGRGHRQALKKLFQDWAVPPWLRQRTPLVFIDGELAAVAGYCTCAGFEAGPGQPGRELAWQAAAAPVR